MKIIPAIDLRGGRCVRLYQGDYGRETVYDADPVELAKEYFDAGASRLHIVDLDGARDGAFQNLQAISDMAKAIRCPIQSGGGIRSSQDIARLFEAGVERAVVGSIAIREPALVREWIGRFGAERICVAFDARWTDNDFRLASAGWKKTHSMTLWDGIESLIDYDLKHVLCTDIGRDGTLSGANEALYREIMTRYDQLSVIASGGVSDLASLHSLQATGVPAVVVGRALLDGRIAIKDVVPCLRAA